MARIGGQFLRSIQLKDPFVLRSVEPALNEAIGTRVRGIERLGKRLVIELDGELFVVIHLMIAGRFRWTELSRKPPSAVLVTLGFDTGWLSLTEAGSKRRARLFLVAGREELARHDPGGLEVVGSDFQEFSGRLRGRRHTLKRALTDPTILSGIGNAYSDEILLEVGLSPVRLTTQLDDAEMERLHQGCQKVLIQWRDSLRSQWGDRFPTTVTAFHPEMAAHGKYLQPCPRCGQAIQRIRYAENETNYCPNCQTGGRLLADRSLSRLLKQDWPRSLEQLEEHLRERQAQE